MELNKENKNLRAYLLKSATCSDIVTSCSSLISWFFNTYQEYLFKCPLILFCIRFLGIDPEQRVLLIKKVFRYYLVQNQQLNFIWVLFFSIAVWFLDKTSLNSRKCRRMLPYMLLRVVLVFWTDWCCSLIDTSLLSSDLSWKSLMGRLVCLN